MCNQNCNQGRNCTCGPRWVPKWHFWAALAAVVIVATLAATVRLCVGYLYCFDDPSAHGTTQVLLCNYIEGTGGTLDFTAHKDGSASLYLRYYNRAAPGVSGEIPQGTWGEWQHIGGSRLAQEVARLRAETVTYELIP